MKKEVQITQFSSNLQKVTIETDEGKIRISFADWKKLRDAYNSMVGIKPIKEG